VREPHKLEYFAHSEWVDPPARMLAPLIVAAAFYLVMTLALGRLLKLYEDHIERAYVK